MLKKMVFLLSPKTHFLDLAGPDQVFFEAMYFGAPFQLEYCAYCEQVDTASGLPLGKLKPFVESKLNAGDYVLLPGMDIHSITEGKSIPNELYEWLRKAYAAGANLCSVCTGAFLLAKSGLLDGKSCTTHWKYTQKLQTIFPKLRVKENVLYTEQDRLFTSAGIASGIDMALHIVEKEMGQYFAHKVARELVVYIRRSGNEAQHSVYLNYRNHIHAGIHKVQDRLVENLQQPTSVQELADLAHMSARSLTRIFKKETGITLGDYITHLRREKIKELSKNPDLSRRQLARAIGLTSERQLNRVMAPKKTHEIGKENLFMSHTAPFSSCDAKI